jgi:acyl carrier protein
MAEPIGSELRRLIADVLAAPEALEAPDDTPLFGPPLAMTSLSGVELLARIHDRYGVDIARDDLDLRSLESVGTLSAYVERHRNS